MWEVEAMLTRRKNFITFDESGISAIFVYNYSSWMYNKEA